MTKAKVPARIDGILARAANVAVVFRRGPSKSTQLLRWDLDTDEIVAGQWIGGHVYTRRCDLSPDGALLAGAFTNYSRSAARQREERGEPAFESWTAISRPPFFSALRVWEGEGAWNLGGLWTDAGALELNEFPAIVSGSDQSSPLKVSSLGLPRSEDEPIFSMRLERAGWRTVREIELREKNPEWRENRRRMMEAMESGAMMDPARFGELMPLMENSLPVFELVHPGRMEKSFDGGRLVRTIGHPGESWSVHDREGGVRLTFERGMFEPQWLDVEHRGRVIYGDAGRLWAWADFPSGEPTLVADLNAHVFEAIAPPDWAREWPE